MQQAQQQAQGTNGQQAQQEDIEITLTLKVSVVNTIIAALDELPHKYSRPVIDLISQQAMPQVNASQPPQGPLSDKTIVQ